MRIADTAFVIATISEAFRNQAPWPRLKTAGSPHPSKAARRVWLPDCESARMLLARIAARLRQPQWSISLVTLAERLGVEHADSFHASRGRIALVGQD
jgi:hypothetical protein